MRSSAELSGILVPTRNKKRHVSWVQYEYRIPVDPLRVRTARPDEGIFTRTRLGKRTQEQTAVGRRTAGESSQVPVQVAQRSQVQRSYELQYTKERHARAACVRGCEALSIETGTEGRRGERGARRARRSRVVLDSPFSLSSETSLSRLACRVSGYGLSRRRV